MSHLPLEEYPPLADYDWAPHLIQKSFLVGPAAVHPRAVLISRVPVLGSTLRHCEKAHILGPHESISQGVHYPRLPRDFQGELTQHASSLVCLTAPQTFVGFMNPVAINCLLT